MNDSIGSTPDAPSGAVVARDSAPRRRVPVAVRVGILGVFGLFYAYAVWNVVAQIVALNELGLSAAGWALLVFSAVFPLIVLIAAGALGWARRLGEMAIILLAGLGVVAVFWLNMVSYLLRNFDIFLR